jgi:hypothetical protein
MTLLELANEIDQLHSEVRDIAPDVAKYLARAWWIAEQAYREDSGMCSAGHAVEDKQPACQCCRHFARIGPRLATTWGA